MATYSIDLGIDANATGCALGTKDSPYPLQIGLTEVVPIRDPSTGQLISIAPKALASFTHIQSGDVVVFSIFNITSIGSKGGKSFTAPQPFQVTFKCLDGKEKSPWGFMDLAGRVSECKEQKSLTFALPPATECSWPCFFLLNESGGIASNKVAKVPERISYLLTVLIPVCLAGVDSTELSYFRVDPEMVISPDGGPGGDPTGNEDPAPDQSTAIAATSR